MASSLTHCPTLPRYLSLSHSAGADGKQKAAAGRPGGVVWALGCLSGSDSNPQCTSYPPLPPLPRPPGPPPLPTRHPLCPYWRCLCSAGRVNAAVSKDPTRTKEQYYSAHVCVLLCMCVYHICVFTYVSVCVCVFALSTWLHFTCICMRLAPKETQTAQK